MVLRAYYKFLNAKKALGIFLKGDFEAFHLEIYFFFENSNFKIFSRKQRT
jgi:hypothetical protein